MKLTLQQQKTFYKRCALLYHTAEENLENRIKEILNKENLIYKMRNHLEECAKKGRKNNSFYTSEDFALDMQGLLLDNEKEAVFKLFKKNIDIFGEYWAITWDFGEKYWKYEYGTDAKFYFRIITKWKEIIKC